eukprot:TRINITY_DN29964_c0_g1_i1.p1 TRINITY_DN29964_c0_g1~~TRINITY_DN29964_c0_g1_i1.p1  ORF type:complete len:423 (+),score=47.24 TRINITY_DN29964_c0_g1_i1:58-1326(+)
MKQASWADFGPPSAGVPYSSRSQTVPTWVANRRASPVRSAVPSLPWPGQAAVSGGYPSAGGGVHTPGSSLTAWTPRRSNAPSAAGSLHLDTSSNFGSSVRSVAASGSARSGEDGGSRASPEFQAQAAAANGCHGSSVSSTAYPTAASDPGCSSSEAAVAKETPLVGAPFDLPRASVLARHPNWEHLAGSRPGSPFLRQMSGSKHGRSPSVGDTSDRNGTEWRWNGATSRGSSGAARETGNVRSQTQTARHLSGSAQSTAPSQKGKAQAVAAATKGARREVSPSKVIPRRRPSVPQPQQLPQARPEAKVPHERSRLPRQCPSKLTRISGGGHGPLSRVLEEHWSEVSESALEQAEALSSAIRRMEESVRDLYCSNPAETRFADTPPEESALSTEEAATPAHSDSRRSTPAKQPSRWHSAVLVE